MINRIIKHRESTQLAFALKKVGTFVLLLISFHVMLLGQCPDGETNITILMDNEAFPSENSWELWDATAGEQVVCFDNWTNGTSVDVCITNGNTYELYGYESFGDGWNSGTLEVITSEDASNYMGSCFANEGNVLFSGTSLASGNGFVDCQTEGPSGFLTATFSTACIACEIVCPSDIVVSSEPGMCGANVTIPLPMSNGVCDPAVSDMSGFYPVGTTEVVFSADANGASGGVGCSVMVTVTNTNGPIVSTPSDQTISLDGGACSSVVNYTIDAEVSCEATPLSLSQNNDSLTINNSFACPGGSNSYYRVWNLQDEGVLTDFTLESIDIGVFEAFNLPAVTVRIHELNGPLAVSNLELISENTMNISAVFNTLVNFPIVADLEAEKTYVVEVVTPGSIFSGFVMGINSAGQTAPSYLRSNFCNISTITDLATIASSNEAIVMNLNGIQESFSIMQTSGLPAGSEFPIGSTTNTFVVTDASGNTTESSFSITVNEFANPISTLACNNLVNISLDVNCEALITPDMVLEGGPYGCYDNYTVTIKDLLDNEFGNMVTGDMIGLELIAEVADQEGNYCWGDIVIEDKLAPMLECSERTTQCTEDTKPGSLLSDLMRFNFEPNVAISASDVSSTDIPIEIFGLDGAEIADLNIELEISHTWVSDLSVVLVSPAGTEATLFISPGTFCPGDDIDVTIDDEADLTADDLATTCLDQTPAIEGAFQSASPLSIFDGENPNGTWIVRVNDFAAGDGGQFQNVTLEITQTGGIVGLPIPDGATFQPFGDQSFFVFGLDPCGPAVLTYEDESEEMDCTSPYTEVIYRTYTATDESGNNAVSCEDTIYVLRTDLGTLEFPENYDDLDLPSISCTAGYPTPSMTGSPTGDFCENVQMDYTDIVIDICEGSYKILRYWTIFEWCSSEVVEHTQIIKVTDQEGPVITCPTIGTISTGPYDCQASILLPSPTISDNCSTVSAYTVETTAGTIIEQGGTYNLVNLDIGSVTVTYTATDNCGNSSSCSITFEVVDNVSPVAVCEQFTTVSLSFETIVTVDAETFDDGSYDQCSDVTYSVRRMTDVCDVPGNTAFGSSTTFCCEDVGSLVMVEFRVEDSEGNVNTCMVEVEVQDKIAPAIQVPPNITLNCQEDYTDLNLTGGLALGFDNCEIEDISFIDIPSIGSCGSGQVSRVFTVTDKSGLTATGTQIIFLIDNDPFDINDITFPSNVTLTSCTASIDPSSTGEPILNDDICSQVTYNFWDDTFVIVEDACQIIYREWTVIDECQYGNSTNPNLGIWKDIQVIEIVNNTAPVITTPCIDQSFPGFGNCEDEVTIGIEATDDCTPSDKLVYEWKIDAFDEQDGIFEFQNTGSELTEIFPFGTHRIYWTVADKCGNLTSCSYLFTVEDAKPPTPYCIGGLSTAVMSFSGEVTIWASDFALASEDNCSEDILVSFSEDVIQTSRTFNCEDIPNGIAQLVEGIQVWFWDEAGNKDYCTVSLLLEDNEADFCEDMSTVTASGTLTTENNQLIEKVDLEATTIFSGDVMSTSTDDGTYAFDLIPNIDYSITAEKNLDPLNGVTTLDIVLIQKHILALQVFDSPYKTIAADTDNNGQVSGSDIIAIRKLILGLSDAYPNDQKSWRFLDKNQSFSDVYNVFPYDEVLDVNFSAGNPIEHDFYGVKIGDINQSADPANFTSNIDTRKGSELDLWVNNRNVEKGATIEIPVFADNFEDMIAYQMTIEFDYSVLEIVDMKAGALDVSENDINVAFAQKGMVSALWSSVEATSSDDILFTLIVKVKKDTDLNDVFRTSSRLTETMAYNEQAEALDISFSTRENDVTIPADERLLLYPNTPNPFSNSTLVSFDLPKEATVNLYVYSMDGKLVHTLERDLRAGYQSIEVQEKELLGAGVYYYTVTTSSASVSSKMILID